MFQSIPVAGEEADIVLVVVHAPHASPFSQSFVANSKHLHK
jgi:hypothetical protein